MSDRYTNTSSPSTGNVFTSPRDLNAESQYYLPDDASKERVKGYMEAEQLLDIEQHKTLFEVNDEDTKASYIPLDFAGMLSRLMRHYTFSPGFKVRAIDQKGKNQGNAHIERIVENSDAVTLFREVSESLPLLGDAVIRVDLVEPERVGSSERKTQAFMRYVKPHQARVRRSMLDNQLVEEVELAWLFPASTFGYEGESRSVVLREVHVPGSFQFHLGWWDNEKLTDGDESLWAEFPDLEQGELETGIDEIPIVFIANNRKAGSFWGRSEFSRIKPIIKALEKRLAQLDEVLEKHARPKLVVGPGTLDEEGQTLMEQFDVIEVESSMLEKSIKPEYLVWDMKIEAIKHEIEKLEEYFFMLTETSPASFGLERDGSQVESARALRFKAHRTINKVEDLRDPFGDAVRKLLRIAQKLETSTQGEYRYKVSRVKLEWPDPIIEDDTQEAQDYGMLKQNQLVSIHRAVKDLHELTDDEAEKERARILEDEVDFAEAVGAGLVPGLGGGTVQPLPEGGEAAPAGGLGGVIPEDTANKEVVLNGAQVTALVAVVGQVTAGQLQRESAIKIIVTAFGLDEVQANEILADAGQGFVPKAKEPVTPPPAA